MRKNKIFIIAAAGVLLAAILIWDQCSVYNGFSKYAPYLTVKYKNKYLHTVNTFYNWFCKEQGGNSNMGPEPETAVKDIKPVEVLANSELEINFNTKTSPQYINIVRWDNGNIAENEKYNYDNKNKLLMPKEKGIYVYEITGVWDETHTSSYALKVQII